jgi:cyclopropane-fatty-acyl-phospholipid synthase
MGRAPPTASRALARALLQRIIGKIERGGLLVETPAGGRIEMEGRQPGPQARLTIHSWRCLPRLLTGWDLGFSEAYMAGECSTPDLTALLGLACLNSKSVASTPMLRPLLLMLRFRHAINRNTRRGSRRNIAAHYDLGNRFYAHCLDSGMTYSSALYSSPRLARHWRMRSERNRTGSWISCGSRGRARA